MPPKKSARTSVKAKTSVLSSVAVQVALVAGGAAIMAAAAAFVSVKASRTQLTVSVVSVGRNPIITLAGDRNVATASLSFKAAAKAVSLNALALTVIADNDGEFKKNVTDDLSAGQLLTGCRLLDGKQIISQASAADPLAFSVNNFVIPARASRRVNVVCDLVKQQPAGNDADIFALGLAKATDVTATLSDPNGTTVPPSAVSFGVAVSGLNMKGQTWSVLVNPATVTVVSPPAPVQHTYCPDADADGYPVGGTACVQAAAAAAGQIPPRADGKLDCNDADVGVHPGAGEIPGNNVDDDCDGLSLAARLSGAAAAPMITLASGSPSGSSVPGYAAVLRFNVSAPWGADTALRGFLFRVLSTDNAQSGWNACTGLGQSAKWRLYDANDLSTPLAGTQPVAVLNEEGAPCRHRPGIASFVSMPLEPDALVSEGTTRTFVLMADTSGASAASDDTLRVELPFASSLPATMAANTVTWTERIPPSNWQGDADIRTLPVIGGTIVY